MISVILCGGSGSRLWPLSRERQPKPFVVLPDGQSLIQKSFLHAAGLPETEEILVIANKELHFKAAEELEASGIDRKVFYILEPFGRNTAPAIATAALEVRRRYGGETPLLILAADHLISNQKAFGDAVSQALDLVSKDMIVTFGVKPDRPETGFGYIEAEGSKVLRFVEKPDEETARSYLATGNFFWNAGIFGFKADVLLRELARYAPKLVTAVETCLASSRGQRADISVLELEASSFAAAPDISIDYALMEKSDRVAVTPCDIGWSDVGSWTAFCALNDADPTGNHVQGRQVLLEDVENCDIRSGDRLVAVLGVEDLLIVDTPDAVLVAAKDRDNDVKSVYDRLKREGNEAYKFHNTVSRPWGSYTLLENGPRFKIKRLVIKPGEAISLQHHHHRSEHWVVVSGMAEVTHDDQTFFVNTNESTYIKAGHKHRMSNRGLIDLVVIEVQSGDYLGEDDIVRFEDNYGRIDAAAVGGDKSGEESVK
ncbi:mannose-1-phosphate guanylyltransferase/mannose-6-phosphate isomerase [Alphaproteobacteria bacterium]|nr:mannose-1-phosphate guanylyltransferase/mannose-6-phosphate isomerase [Alphaproteobacteria bacterium]